MISYSGALIIALGSVASARVLEARDAPAVNLEARATAPPITTVSPPSDPCPTLCIDYINECGIWYGGCAPQCSGAPFPTYSKPPCPSSTTTKCATSTGPSTIQCNPILKPGEFGVPYASTYQLATTSCPGKAPSSTPKEDYGSDCPKTTSKPTKTKCATSTITGSVMCNPILKPGMFGVPYQATYPLPVTSCPGKKLSSTPRVDYRDCPRTTAASKQRRDKACTTSTVSANIACNPILGPDEFGVPYQSPYGLAVTSCKGKTPSSTPKEDYGTDCPKTTAAPCQTAIVDALKDCGSTSIKYGYKITSCSGKKPSSTVSVPTCPTPTKCVTALVDARKECKSTTIGYGYQVTSCKGQKPSSTVKTPTCPTPTTTACVTSLARETKNCKSTTLFYGVDVTSCPGKKPVTATEQIPPCPTESCNVINVDAIKDCGSTTIGFGGLVTVCEGKPPVTGFTSPSCPTPTKA